MNERTLPAESDSRHTSRKRVIGDYLIKIDEVPKEVRDYAINKLSPTDSEGKALKDAEGKDIRIGISTAKENGSYYGPVVLNNDKYIVQAVGKDHNYAVVHPKDKVDLQGSTLSMLDAKKRLNGFNVQIHYTDDQAKAYPFKPKEQDKEQPAQQTKEQVKPESMIAQAQEYAAKNIKHAGQRAAFLKHMENVTREAFQPEAKAQQQPSRAMQGSAKTQQAEQSNQGLER